MYPACGDILVKLPRGRLTVLTVSLAVCACVLSRVKLFETPWTVACRLLCPRGFPGKNTGVGCHALLRGSSRPRD